MNDLEYEFILQDRIAKIKAINEQYDLLNNSYISFSGGKDSVVLSYLIDIALPDNKMPRVYANTGIEYVDMVKFVKLKKDLMHKWQKDNNKSMVITGMRKAEGGNRTTLSCLTTKNTKFHPLVVITDDWENEFINRNKIQLCKLYYEPFNFKRTGCKGCPFALEIQDELNVLYKLLPNEYYQCLHLWKPVYDEYIRIGYRLKYYPHERIEQNEKK